MPSALILDFDGSVAPMEGTRTLDLRDWQEAVRFACRRSLLAALGGRLRPQLVERPSVVFLGSGDFHHVSWLLISSLQTSGRPIQLVVLDNHPDNMRYPFGIHCGSWVWHVSRLPFIARVHVLGIGSADVEGLHALENHLAPLRSGKVVYWCVQRDLRVLHVLGARQSRSFPSVTALLEAFRRFLSETSEPLYLSIDKDVLAPDVVRTNWDQGCMRIEELEQVVAMVRDRLIGADVVGDVSAYRYRSRMKRLMSAFDHQPEIPDELLASWQEEQQQVNRRLLSMLEQE